MPIQAKKAAKKASIRDRERGGMNDSRKTTTEAVKELRNMPDGMTSRCPIYLAQRSYQLRTMKKQC